VTGSGFIFIFLFSFHFILLISKRKTKGAECPGMIQRKDPQKRGHAPFLWGIAKKKKGSCGGFPNPRETIKRNRTCGWSAIGRAGKGYPPVPYCTWS
jgi:hypothetical protein